LPLSKTHCHTQHTHHALQHTYLNAHAMAIANNTRDDAYQLAVP